MKINIKKPEIKTLKLKTQIAQANEQPNERKVNPMKTTTNIYQVKPLTQEYINHLYELDCEYAAHKLALQDPNSEASKHKAKLDAMLSSL